MSSQHLALDNTFGAGYIGVVVASSLHGVSCLQAWYYFTHHWKNDAWPTKALVSAVMIFDTMHQILISHSVYIYLITNFGNDTALADIVWSLVAEVIFNGLTAFLVQSFLTVRLWRLSNRNVLLTGFAAVLVVGEFCCVLAYAGMAFHFRTFAELARLKPLAITVNTLASAGDVFIAATMCTLLHRSRTGFHRSDTMINKLIVFVVNTGCITSLCAVSSTISLVAAGETFLYIAFFFCIGRLYSNSLLATLNARDLIRNTSDGGRSTDISLALREIPKAATAGTRRQNDISINIETTRERAMDRDSEQEQDKNGRNARRSSDLMNEKGESTIIMTAAGYGKAI